MKTVINKTCACGCVHTDLPQSYQIVKPVGERDYMAGIYFDCSCGSTLFIPWVMPPKTGTKIAAILLASSLAGFVTGCGGDGAQANVSPVSPLEIVSPSPSPSVSVTPSPSPSISASPSPSPSASPSPYVFSGGSGIQADPYQLENVTDVQHIDDHPAAYFVVMIDIDMSGVNFRPLAAFSGTVYGNNHHLFNMTLSTSGSATAALFVSVSGTIVQLFLSNATISSAAGYATGFAGSLTGLISNCGVVGSITSPLGGNGFNTGTGNGVYVTKTGSGSTINTTQNVTFNGNHVTNTL